MGWNVTPMPIGGGWVVEGASDSFWCFFYIGDGNEDWIGGGYILAG